MNHRDWMRHCVQLGREHLAAYHRAAPELRQRLMTAREAAWLAWLVQAQEQALALLDREIEPQGHLAPVVAYLRAYADLHVRWWTRDGAAVREGVVAARRQLVDDLRRMRERELA